MKHILCYILIFLYSCSPVKQTASELRIKGKTTISVYTDKSLDNKSIIQGFVYSRKDSSFIEYAAITIDKEAKIGTMSDENGYFKYEVRPGLYAIECFCVGHVSEITKKLKVEKGQNIVIIFELGTDMNID